MKRPPTLTGSQRRQLRALAHHLSPIVQVGHQGITDELVRAVRQALEDHELVKVRIAEGAPVERKSSGLADRLDAHEVGVIGRVVILYRRHPDKPAIPLRG
jgi:RNA-binding protein